ncbi:MAG: hypothetical protein F6K54_31155 [Okeania sp. SIO3B5]|uniref:hypothetical protein n=1 Tax=Okeania sp. SIO3B5 TaxID=2607811 RepID=UPI0013FEAA9E|nr:hypothetical protein [Okeania sp. SIO3B5]NEO57139.1 hypothetical protein [Okeania sp. SIO3B5]
MSENNEGSSLDDLDFNPGLIRGVKKDSSEADNYSGNYEQVETEEESEEVNEVLQVETERKNYRELSQEISLLREKLEQFSQDVESNYSHLQKEVSRLSYFMLELQDEKLNGDVDLGSLFGRVNSLENSWVSLPGQIEERINSTFDSQQEVNEKFQQFVADTKQEIEEIVRMVVDVESQQIDAHKLSQDISLLREKLEEFSNVESNSSQLQEQMAELSSNILELQEERSNIGVGLEPLFRRVKLLENSLESLPGQIEERVNSTFGSQQQVNEKFPQFVESQELSQEISLLREKLEQFSQDVESNYSELQKKVSRMSDFMLELEKKRLKGDVNLKTLFGRVKSLENSLESLPGKIEERINITLDAQKEIDEEISHNFNLSQQWQDFFDISIVYFFIAMGLSFININANIFLTLLCLILALPFLLENLVVFLWSYASIFLMFGHLLFYYRPSLVAIDLDHFLFRHPFIDYKNPFISILWFVFYILAFPIFITGLIWLEKSFPNCLENMQGCLNAKPEVSSVIVLFIPFITLSWFIIYLLLCGLITLLALLKGWFIEE